MKQPRQCLQRYFRIHDIIPITIMVWIFSTTSVICMSLTVVRQDEQRRKLFCPRFMCIVPPTDTWNSHEAIVAIVSVGIGAMFLMYATLMMEINAFISNIKSVEDKPTTPLKSEVAEEEPVHEKVWKTCQTLEGEQVLYESLL